jgi:opacity protein-like surface antigen
MRKLLIVIIVFTSSLVAKSQYHHEIGPTIGVGYYLGDLVNNQFVGEPNLNFGALYRFDYNNRISFRIAAHYGMITGDSKNNKKTLQYKNLSFRSPLTDIEMGMEINFVEYQPGSKNHRFTPFIFGGLSVFKFNPQANFQGKWVDLQPLGTEGQGTTAYPDRKPYRLMSWAIPFGGGLKWNISKNVTIGIEYGLRKTFTDYLDDVSSTYPDLALLSAEKSPLSAMLSNRQFEDEAAAAGLNLTLGPNNIPMDKDAYTEYLETSNIASGSQRGLVTDKDWYGIMNVTIMFKLVGAKTKGCPAYKKNNYFKEYNL